MFDMVLNAVFDIMLNVKKCHRNKIYCSTVSFIMADIISCMFSRNIYSRFMTTCVLLLFPALALQWTKTLFKRKKHQNKLLTAIA